MKPKAVNDVLMPFAQVITPLRTCYDCDRNHM